MKISNVHIGPFNELKQFHEQIRNPAPATAGFDNTNLAPAGFTKPESGTEAP